MFTGIVEGTAAIGDIKVSQTGARIRMDLGALAQGVAVGDSIALNGVCLTVVSLGGTVAEFDAVPETLRLTTLGSLKVGDEVNVERALRVGDRLGGHFVQGHVDGVGVLTADDADGDSRRLRFSLAPALAKLMIHKGSVAVDGVSLTLTEAGPDGFAVAVIPHTLQVTALKQRRVGDPVNVEVDMLAKHVAHLLGQTK